MLSFIIKNGGLNTSVLGRPFSDMKSINPVLDYSDFDFMWCAEIPATTFLPLVRVDRDSDVLEYPTTTNNNVTGKRYGMALTHARRRMGRSRTRYTSQG
jgi:hypothetical protein